MFHLYFLTKVSIFEESDIVISEYSIEIKRIPIIEYLLFGITHNVQLYKRKSLTVRKG